MQVKNRFTGRIIGEFNVSSGADLRWADLRKADLCWADLRKADLCWADLRGTDFREADLRDADFRWANLRGTDLRDADLRDADFRWANLCEADLRKADLCEAKVNDIKWPAPTMVLLAYWGNVSNELCIALMHYDAENHPDPSLFDEWANSNDCPYNDINVQRCCNFQENKSLWTPLSESKHYTAYQLMMMLLKEKCDYEPRT